MKTGSKESWFTVFAFFVAMGLTILSMIFIGLELMW